MPKWCQVWSLHPEKWWSEDAVGALRGRSYSLGRHVVQSEAVCLYSDFLRPNPSAYSLSSCVTLSLEFSKPRFPHL